MTPEIPTLENPPKTIIVTTIENERFKATTPHVPELNAAGSTEGAAVSALIVEIRRHIAAAGGKPVAWLPQPTVTPSKDRIIRRLTGLWPDKIDPLLQLDAKSQAKPLKHNQPMQPPTASA